MVQTTNASTTYACIHNFHYFESSNFINLVFEMSNNLMHKPIMNYCATRKNISS